MVRISPTIRRTYIATAAVISTLLVFRPTFSGEWTPDVVLVAGLADLLVLCALAGIFWISTHVIEQESLAGRLNRLLHFLICCLVILVGAGAQALYLKTGEILDFEIIGFFVGNFSELLGATASEVDSDLLLTFLIVLGFAFLALLRFSRASLKVAQYAVFALPIFLLLFGKQLEPEPIDATFTAPGKKDSLYQGQYRAITTHQMRWNSNGEPTWRKGILTGMSLGSAIGVSEYLSIARKAGSEVVYVAPRVASRPVQKGPNVVFIILESTRHDALGVYRSLLNPSVSSPSDTPFLDGLARSGWMVERAYTTIPHTSKALIGIYCGTFARFESQISEALPGNLPLACLPQLLSKAGYQSAHFQTAPGGFEGRIDLLKNLGFDHFTSQETFEGKGWEQFGYLGLDDRAMIRPALEWMRNRAREGTPYFASLLTVLTHHPYASPGHRRAISTPADAYANYRNAVKYTDELIRELITEMTRQGLMKNTLVVVTGDHGEAFGEHGQIAHNGSSYDEGMRVPLLLYGPDVMPGSGTISGLRQHIDLLPTILAMAKIAYEGKLPGRSLVSDALGHEDVISACFYANYCLNHFARDGRKTLFFYGKRKPELYDLISDPGERTNLHTEESEPLIRDNLLRAARVKNSFEAVYLARPPR